MIDRDRARGMLLGLACGDAVGTTLEFQRRGSFTPITDMVGGGPFHLKPGQWTDDTSMALCLGESLLARRGFDPIDQLARYLNWYEHGYLSSTGQCFDIGNTVRAALDRFAKSREPFCGSDHPKSAGNGSIMRLAPAALFYAPHHEAAVHFAGMSSRTTHQANEAVDACRFLADRLLRALDGATKEEISLGPFLTVSGPPLCTQIQSLADGKWRTKSREQIRGTGYVVDSLEAALWCFARANTFAEAVLEAANLGDDADTTAAICGQLAGAFFGEQRIPKAWREKLHLREEMGQMAEALVDAAAMPFSRCYWAEPGRLLAGAYPSDLNDAVAADKIRGLLTLGIRTFINLTEAGELGGGGCGLRDYTGEVARQSQALGISDQIDCLRFPIVDLSVPSAAGLQQILGAVRSAIEAGRPTYVHCWGGRGRTGTVVGAYLIAKGYATANDFTEKIGRLRQHDPGGGSSPETKEQCELVRKFARTVLAR